MEQNYRDEQAQRHGLAKRLSSLTASPCSPCVSPFPQGAGLRMWVDKGVSVEDGEWRLRKPMGPAPDEEEEGWVWIEKELLDEITSYFPENIVTI